MVNKEENQENKNDGRVNLKSSVRTSAISHPAVDAPLCSDCRQSDLAFFDPSCPGCQEILKKPRTTIAEVFAIIRQWVPQTQKNIELFVNEILRRGAHVDDRDGLTDMTLLQYSCKAGAAAVGDVNSALKVIKMLLEKGADVHFKCRWTNMNALHYASYFDVAPVVKLILMDCKGVNVNSRCHNYDNGTALHIAATNLCLEAAQVLLEFDADVTMKDDLSRTPLECIPDMSFYSLIPDIQDRVSKMQHLLAHDPGPLAESAGKINLSNVSGKAVLQALNLQLNDRVIVGGCKMGTLRYCGTTEFATGIWAGIELDDNKGKNDGSVKGVVYFKCPPNHGIFAPVNKVCKADEFSSVKTSMLCRNIPRTTVNHGKVDVSHVTPKVCTGLNLDHEPKGVKIGEKITIPGNGRSEDRCGTVRYIGTTTFAPGCWVGIELDQEANGRHNGTVRGTRYFDCPPHHGLLISASKLARCSEESDAVCDSLKANERDSHCWRNHSTGIAMKQTKKTLTRSQSVDSRSQSTTRTPLIRSISANHKEKISRRNFCSVNNGRNDYTLSLGTTVLYNHKLGVVKYIGPVDFAEGKWLGLELKDPKGKHDGVVNERRYFTSKPGHGIMVHPKNVTLHGINTEKFIG